MCVCLSACVCLSLCVCVCVCVCLSVCLSFLTHFTHFTFSRRFYPKRLTIAVRLYIFISMCVPWESNPQPFALLTQCSTTEPHRNTVSVCVCVSVCMSVCVCVIICPSRCRCVCVLSCDVHWLGGRGLGVLYRDRALSRIKAGTSCSPFMIIYNLLSVQKLGISKISNVFQRSLFCSLRMHYI